MDSGVDHQVGIDDLSEMCILVFYIILSFLLCVARSSRFNPFRTAVPFWRQTAQVGLGLGFDKPQSRFQVVCTQNGTAVLKGLREVYRPNKTTSVESVFLLEK